jgi:hypothetical protein
MKLERKNTSPITNSTSTTDAHGDRQKLVPHSSSRKQSLHTVLTDFVNQ